MNIKSFKALPYNKRQIIVVREKSNMDDIGHKKENNIQSAVEYVKKYGEYVLIPGGITTLAAVHFGKKLYDYAKDELSKKQEKDHIAKVAPVVIDMQLAERLSLSPGHPHDNTVYGGNPHDSIIYYPLSEFHVRLMEHKVREVLTLLRALGAKELEVRCKQGYSNEIAASLSSTLPLEMPVDVGIKGGTKRSKSGEILFLAKYGERSVKPSIPKGLKWYPHEEMWKHFAQERIKHNLKEFNMSVDYISDFGINAELTAKFEGYGLSIGGSYTEFKKTQWIVSGKF